ncbi:Pyrophosphate-energized vacuolar membrane proton pump 1, partial [Sarracenia purpurea var. burkii]
RLLVPRVKLSSNRNVSSPTKSKNGYIDYLIEEEEGINDHSVVAKCVDIQNAISEVINDKSLLFVIGLSTSIASTQRFSCDNKYACVCLYGSHFGLCLVEK